MDIPHSTYKILVTGGAGFIGSHIVDAFVAQGHSVAVLDNLSTGKRENLNPAARFYRADLRDAPAVAEIVAAEGPEIICHQAALADVRASVADPATYAQVNVVGTLNLLQAARAAGTVRRFLFASTGGAVYGDPEELPASERCPARPLDPYGASKLACEYYLYTYQHNFGLEPVILRYANVYGPRQDPYGEAGVVAIFAAAMQEGREVTINGDGRQTRDFVYVRDVAAANVLALTRGAGIYNIGTGLPTDILTIYRALARLIGYQRPPRHGPPKPGEARHNYLDASKAQRELGWTAETSLKEGLRRTVAEMRRGM
ncbi:MAG: NAD-dependent epimerase/dehydratase family protein [Anaerolineae bacterium]